MAKKDAKAPDDAAEGADGEAPAKKKPPLPILIAAGVGAVALLGGGGAAAYFMFLAPKPAAQADAKGEKKKDEKHAKKDDKGKKGEKGKGGGEEEASRITEGPDGVYFYAVPDFVVNLAATNGRPAYLKLKVTLEAKDIAAIEAIDPAMPRVMDQFTGFLRELRMEDLAGSAGSYRLRLELLRRVNLAIAPAKVDAVLIEEMLVQ